LKPENIEMIIDKKIGKTLVIEEIIYSSINNNWVVRIANRKIKADDNTTGLS